MSEIDFEIIRRKLELLSEHLRKLAEFKNMDEKTFLSDHHNFGLAEHYLQLSIEIILDVCRSLVVALELKTPEDSRGLLEALSESKVLPKEFFEKNKNMAGFRNRLVHEYAEIDHKKIYDYLQNYFNELERFISLIALFAKQNSAPN